MTLINDVVGKWGCPEHAELPIDEKIHAAVSLCYWLMGQVQIDVDDTRTKIEFVVSDCDVREMLRMIIEKREPATATVPVRDMDSCLMVPTVDDMPDMVTFRTLLDRGNEHFHNVGNSFFRMQAESRQIAEAIFFYLYYSTYNITDYRNLRIVAWLSSVLGFSAEVRHALVDHYDYATWKNVDSVIRYVTYGCDCLFMMSREEYAHWVMQWVQILTTLKTSPRESRLVFNAMGRYVYDVCHAKLEARGYVTHDWLDIKEDESLLSWLESAIYRRT